MKITGRGPAAAADISEAEVAADPGAEGSRTILRTVGTNALARMVVLPVNALLGIVLTRLLIDNYGEATYAQYALIVGIAALLPFADLGLGAAIINATGGAEDPRRDQHLRDVLVSCIRLLSVSGAGVVLLSLVLTFLGAWGSVLGSAASTSSSRTTAAMCVVVFGLTFVIGIGQRLLAGLGKFVWVVCIDALQTPIVLLTLVLMIATGVQQGVYLAVAAYAATALLAGVAAVLANRLVRPNLRMAIGDAVRLRSVRGARVFDTAWPMLVQMIAVALAMQTDRLVLSHSSTVGQLAVYSLAAQMFMPVVGVVAAASTALWPVFARARARGVRSEASPLRFAALFGACALVVASIISAFGGWLGRLASGGEIDIVWPVLLAFSAFVVVQAVKYPLGTFLTDVKGLRYQAAMIGLMVPVKIALSLALAERYGALGPVVASVISITLFEVVANLIYIRRHPQPAA